ncbi:MAG: GNAT family N-acetyltransferase [Acidobacteriota bacterium]|nr:GNAT family N-acetyltransferase [Acidobacteriota bacterium]
MDTNYKLADASDADALLVMMREFYAHEHLAFDEALARAALLEILGDGAFGRVWLISHKGEVAGYVVLTFGFSLEFGGRYALVDELYIDEAHRGRGVGTQTLGFVAEACRTFGVSALCLEVERSNTIAHTVYRKFGFTDHDRYLMTKWMSD